MPEKHIRAGAAHGAARRGAALWIVALAIAVMPFAAAAQSTLPSPGQSVVIGNGASSVTQGTAPAPKQVDLNAVPQASAPHSAAVREAPRPRTLLSEQQYRALKEEAARKRFDMRGIRPLPPPASPGSGSTTGTP